MAQIRTRVKYLKKIQQFSLWSPIYFRTLCEWHFATIFRGYKPLSQEYIFKMRSSEKNAGFLMMK